jgi:hypothetical protein
MILINQVFIRIIPENGRQKFQVDKMTLLALRFILALGLILPAGQAGVSTGPGTGFIPINDLGLRLYLDQFQGGLYAGGSNQVPPAHILAGLAHNAAIQPLDTAGRPDPAGRFVLLSVGMSNTTQEFWAANHRGPATAWSFAGQAAANSIVNHTTLAIVDGAMGGQAAHVWVSPSSPNYNRVRDEQLAPLGLTEAQVQAVWLKQADIQPTVPLPNANADAFILEKACRIRYPNLQIVFLSSRIYAGYAASSLNPEPYAYESGFSVQRLVQAQINQMAGGPIDPIAGNLNHDSGVAPWIAWGPYLWADGLTPRSDGLTWLQSDFENDGTHPSKSGQQKVGAMLLEFLLQSPFSRTWFRAYIPGDINADGTVDILDLKILMSSWRRLAGRPDYDLRADLNGDNRVDVFDLQILAANWGFN